MADDRRSLSGEFSPFSSDLFDLVQDLSGVVWEFSFAANRFTFVSAHAEALTGWPAHQWTDFDSWVAMIHPDDRAGAVGYCRRESSAGNDHDFEYRTVHPDGRVSWVRDVVRPVLDGAGTLTHLRGIMLDVGERRRAFERRQRAVEDWEHLAQINQAIAEDRPPDEVFAVIARATAAAVGADTAAVGQLSGDGIVIRGLSWPARRNVGDHLVVSDHALLWSALRSGRAARVDSAQLADADRDPLLAEIRAEGFVSVVIAPVSVAGRPWGFLAVSNRERDLPVGVEARMERFARSAAVGVTHADTRARLVHRANTDPLTGLGTHRAFQDRLREEVERARREGRPLSLARIDLDQFKPLNDSYGYEAGDRVLADLAQRLGALTGPHDMLARVSGDEFAWILPGADPERAFALAERARTAIGGGEWLPGVFGSASAGVCGSDQTVDPDELMRLAGGALYWAKSQGRGRTVRYTPEVVRELSVAERAERLTRERALAGLRALARAVDAKDHSTREHSERVATVAGLLGERLGFDPGTIEALRGAALLHDVGKIGVPDAVLSKPGRLTDEEYEQVKGHAALGARIAAEVLDASQVAWIRAHHERWDGGGYPDGLAGDAIPAPARVLALADAWDVMRSVRSYKTPMSVAQALAECRRHSGGQFWPAAVEALTQLYAPGRRE